MHVFQVRIRHGDSGPRSGVHASPYKKPLAKHMDDFLENVTGPLAVRFENRRRKHVHLHFLRSVAIDLAQLQKVPCEAPAHSVFMPSPEALLLTYEGSLGKHIHVSISEPDSGCFVSPYASPYVEVRQFSTKLVSELSPVHMKPLTRSMDPAIWPAK